MPRRALLSGLLACLLLAPPAGATWSIVVVDTATGEVGVAGATCLEGFDLFRYLPVIVVGKGGAVAQSAIDTGAVNRQKIWDGLHAGLTPTEILDIVTAGDLQKCARQYGIVDLTPLARGFTGGCALPYKKHVIGASGTLKWAVQGNVLTGLPVIQAARDAVRDTPGRLSDKLMAGMLAAYAMGGDGRCSCEENAPMSCGAPPTEGFEKTAHTGFMVVARMGDKDGTCNGALGCANGDYWLRINAIGFAPDRDPVLELQDKYERWLDTRRGRPDALTSSALFDEPTVRGDGQTIRQLHIVLYDTHGQPITEGGALIAVQHAADSAGLAQRTLVIDHGNGTYTVRMRAGQGVGVDRFEVRVHDGRQRVLLYPLPTLEHVGA